MSFQHVWRHVPSTKRTKGSISKTKRTPQGGKKRRFPTPPSSQEQQSIDIDTHSLYASTSHTLKVSPNTNINANSHGSGSSISSNNHSSSSDYSQSSYSSIDIDILIDNLLEIDWEKIKSYQKSPDKSVVNLSTHVLTPSQKSLLSKGLNFCPMPGEPDVAELKNDLYKFERNLRWKLHWAKRNPNSTTSSVPANNTGTPLITIPQDTTPFENRKFKNKSQAEPPTGTPNIETMFHLAHRDLDNYVPKRTKFQNLTKEENQAIYELSSNPDIVIKKADKGSAIVIQDSTNYVSECERQLNDTEFYERQRDDHTDLYRRLIEETLVRMRENY